MNLNLTSKDVFPSRFIKAEDLNGKVMTLVIQSVKMETMRDATGQEQQKPVLYFAGWGKGLVLNRTNWNTIVEMHGDGTENWTGKPVKIGTERVVAFGKTTDAIRILFDRDIQPENIQTESMF